MNTRELFVFAGQSNMVGASVYPASEQIVFSSSYEYLHKPRRFGYDEGIFKNTGFPSGEFSYIDLQAAYGDSRDPSQKSELGDQRNNTYFSTSICNLRDDENKKTYDFAVYSEKTVGNAVCLPPFIVQGWEAMGRKCAYIHAAKGSTSILHYFDDEMIREANRILGSDVCQPGKISAGVYFGEKVTDFFTECEKKFEGENLDTRVCFWLQGESDRTMPEDVYRVCLDVFWKRLRSLGFTHFFCVRVGYWDNQNIINIIRAQESFCRETENVYMLTRACSFMPVAGQDENSWFIQPPEEKYRYCRDSFYGFKNQHINEKGFRVIAEAALENMRRILIEGKEPILEKENLRALAE